LYNEYNENYDVVDYLSLSFCGNPNCHERAIWLKDKLMYPCLSTAPLPYDDMPSDVKEDFVHDMIIQPKEIEDLFNRLPQLKLKGIKDRDKK